VRSEEGKKQHSRVWVIGGGRFARKAVRRFCQKNKEFDTTVVEHDHERCAWFTTLPVTCFEQDGVQFLEEKFSRHVLPDWIIPMVPFHLAFEWMKQMLSNELKFIPLVVPEEVMQRFPNSNRGDTGRFYTSLADFLCPDDCPAWDHICTVRKKPRPYLLYKKIETEKVSGFSSIVIKSHQIFPGIGGYRPAELYQALHKVKNSEKPILLSTACNCHGVVDLFETCLCCKSTPKRI
jgi:hypothetical protein